LLFLSSSCPLPPSPVFFFLFAATAPTHLYTLSLHDALPIFTDLVTDAPVFSAFLTVPAPVWALSPLLLCAVSAASFVSSVFCVSDRKSTRLNSSHVSISYAVFCLKKKKKM